MGKSKWKHMELPAVMLCAFLTGVSSFLAYTIRNGGFFTLNADFNLQQIPFTMALHNALAEGNPGGWVWNYDLGGSIIQSFGFYEMGSPFFWLTMPFAPEAFPYLIPFLYILKYMTAACTAYLYLVRMVQRRRSAAVGAILYAFSGFQAVNLMFYHFHDVVALFPLMLLGIEKVHENPKEKGFFTMAVALNCLVNYFFFVQNVLFCVIYYFFRFGRRKAWKQMLPSLFSCLLCGLWGVGMAAVLFLPSVLFITGSDRAGWVPLPPVTWPRFTLYVFRGMLFPGEAMSAQSSLYAGNSSMQWMSVGCYLPMTGMALAVAYLRKRKDRLTGILILLLILSLCPAGASAFYLFSEWYYRWWYFLVIMAALASARVLDEPDEYPVRTGTLFSMAAVAALYLILRFVPGFVEDSTLVYDAGKLLIFAGIALAGAMATELLRKRHRLDSRLMLAGVCAFAALTTALTTGYYGALEDPESIRRDILTGTQLETEDPQYRYAQGYNIYNLTGKAAGTSAFSSTISAGSRKLDELFDYRHAAADYGDIIRTVIRVLREYGPDIERVKDALAGKTEVVTNLSLDKASVPGLYALLGARYRVSDERPQSGRNPVREISAEGRIRYVLEEEACPIGFAVSRYILTDDLKALDRTLRGAALLQAAAIDPADEPLVRNLLVRTDGTQVRTEDISEFIRINRENAVTDFERDTRGFRCRTGYASPAAVWFSVPCDSGWTATVDGEETRIIESGGMMLLPVPAGEHTVGFAYETPGYRTGKQISLLCLAAWILFTVAQSLSRRRHARCEKPGRIR